MRLTPEERDAIAAAARQTLLPGTRVSLFGSRVDDSARGGDIDLLLEPGEPMHATEWVARRGAFIARLYALIGERRIDVVLAPQGSGEELPVVSSARRQAVPLVST